MALRYWHFPLIILVGSFGLALAAQSAPDGFLKGWFVLASAFGLFATFLVGITLAVVGALFDRVGDR